LPLTKLFVSGHPKPGEEFLELLVIPGADQQGVIRVDDKEVLEALYSIDLFVVLGDHKIVGVFVEEAL